MMLATDVIEVQPTCPPARTPRKESLGARSRSTVRERSHGADGAKGSTAAAPPNSFRRKLAMTAAQAFEDAWVGLIVLTGLFFAPTLLLFASAGIDKLVGASLYRMADAWYLEAKLAAITAEMLWVLRWILAKTKLMLTPRCHDYGIAVLDVGIDPKGLEAAHLAEIDTKIAVQVMAPATSAHLAGRVAEQLDNPLAGELVVRVHHHDARATKLGSTQAWYVHDVGVGIFLGPFFDSLQRRRRTPVSIALPDRFLALSGQNGKASTPHRWRVGGKYRLGWGIAG